MVVLVKDEIDVGNLIEEKALPENTYPTLEEPAGTEDQAKRTDREPDSILQY